MEAIATPRQSESPLLLVPKNEGLTFLEQLTAHFGQCSAVGVPFLMRSDYQKRSVTFARARCGSWSCPECAMNNTRKWIARTIDGINKLEAKEWHFATVTANGSWRGYASLVNLRKNWHKLRKRMARMAKKQGEALFYVRVWEHHKDGSYHLHIITNVAITTRWLKDNAHSCGLGYQAKIDKSVNAGQAAGYMAKYMLKQSENLNLYKFPKGARRIEASRNWVAWKKRNKDKWQHVGDVHAAKGVATMRKMSGWKIESLAIRNELKREKVLFDDKRRTGNESSKDTDGRTSELASKQSRTKANDERKNRIRQEDDGKKCKSEKNNQNTSNRVEQSTDENEGVLEDDQNKAREST